MDRFDCVSVRFICSFNSNTTGVTCGAGTTNTSEAHQFIPGFGGVRVARSLEFLCVAL